MGQSSVEIILEQLSIPRVTRRPLLGGMENTLDTSDYNLTCFFLSVKGTIIGSSS